MKYLLLVWASAVISIPGVWAQPEVTLSQTFPEPDFAWNQLLQLKNGNTSVYEECGFIQYSSFLQEENTYATVVILRDGKKKEAAIAWIGFD